MGFPDQQKSWPVPLKLNHQNLWYKLFMMIDTAMFLLSFDTNYIGWKHQA